MKRFMLFLALAVMLSLSGCRAGYQSAGDFDPVVLLGLGTGDLPGANPEPFGSGWFEGGFHSAPVFAPDGSQVWWAGRYASEQVFTRWYEDGSWSSQESVSLSPELESYRDPFISPDGKRFFFISEASIPGMSGYGKENVWMAVREDEGWGVPEPLPQTVNQHRLHWTVSVASNYDLYFSAEIGGVPGILKAAFENGTYSDPVSLGPPVNSDAMEFTPNIAPDGSYLLFSRVADNSSPGHLYISYVAGEGWSEPVRVENVESCISPIITPDRGYVIYLEGPEVLAWRDTSFIEELRP